MKILVTLTISLLVVVIAASAQQEPQRIVRKFRSTPTANQLTRVKKISVRSNSAEPGAVEQISSKEAANFGQRSSNENQAVASPLVGATKEASTTMSTTTTSAPSSTTTTTTSSPTTTVASTSAPSSTQAIVGKAQHKASERQQVVPQPQAEVEVLAGAPSSWQTMTAVEAPAAALIAAGTRAALPSDLSASGSNVHSSASDESDFLRSSSSNKGSSYTQQSSASETFSRLRQQSSKQQAYFYPQQQQQQQQVRSKTSNYQGTKTHWYQPTTTTTTSRPAPLVQEQYEQQNEQYVEQQQQVEYGAAPLGQAEPFAFDFKTQDQSGNGQYRKEESDKNGVVRGSYGYTDANGIYRHVEYVADQNGFRANIKSNEPGLIGETQPASIKLDGGAAPARFTAASNNNENGEWSPSSGSDGSSSELTAAAAPPDFESSHKSERLRSPRNYRN